MNALFVDANTYDFRQIESFLTYAVMYLSQKYLGTHVTAHIYGASQKLHPNLRNNLTNLCRRVMVHENEELSLSKALHSPQ